MSLADDLVGPGDILPAAARTFRDKTALVTSTRTLTYAELDALSDSLAGYLQNAGVEAGERVSIYAPNSWEWIVAYHGALKCGAIVNPINAMLTASEVAYVLADCGATVLVAAGECLSALRGAGALDSLAVVLSIGKEDQGVMRFEEAVEEELPRRPVAVSPDDASTIGYTSGTTGHPKGVVQSQQAVVLNCRLTAAAHGKESDDVVVTALPAPHVYGNVVINGAFLTGATVVMMTRFDAREAIQLIQEHRATLFEGVPAMYAMMLAEDVVVSADLSSLVRCTVGGQTMAIEMMQDWEKASGAPLVELWGMTELSGLGTTHPVSKAPVHGSIGLPLPGVQVRIVSVDGSGRDVEPGQPGELWIKGPIVMREYFGRPEDTQESITDGWLHSGDVARQDADGHLWVVDRRKDMIITAGYNIYPAEIERVLAGHPAVALVAVGPVPDQVKGELARAYVVLHEGVSIDAASLLEHCREHLAPYKVPRSVRFVDALPLTSTGKIMRRKLIDEFGL